MSARRALACAPLVVVATLTGAARGEVPAPSKDACADAYESGQKLRIHGRLIDADRELVVCAQEACPAVLRQDCVTWLGEVDASIPTVVILATTDAGRDVDDVRVTLDEKPFVDRLDGHATRVDPGEHTFRFFHGGAPPAEVRVTLRQGEKDRRIAVIVREPRAAPAPPTPAPPRGVPTAGWIFGGVALAALGSSVIFYATGRSEETRYASQCAPTCSTSDVQTVHAKYVVGDVSLGVALASAGITAWLALSSKTSIASQARTAARVRLGVGPERGGGSLTVVGSF